MTPIDAERAFAADARTIGQWTAFRKWSTDDAVMFTPQPTNAHDFLKDRKDPLKVIDWWPTASYISCDGKVAVNTGGWQRPDGSVGYFSTVWQRQPNGGWKWIVDGGDVLKVARARPSKPEIVVAKCGAPLAAAMSVDSRVAKVGEGRSDDQTLFWAWIVGRDGSRTFTASIAAKSQMVRVIDDKIPAPPK